MIVQSIRLIIVLYLVVTIKNISFHLRFVDSFLFIYLIYTYIITLKKKNVTPIKYYLPIYE